MTQTKEFPTTQSRSECKTCADCPKFQDFRGQRNRGWCSAFDQVTRAHHPFTENCHVMIAVQALKRGQKVMVHLVTHAHEVDPERGFSYPKDEQIIEFSSLPEITKEAVESAIATYREFQGYFIARFWEPQEDEF